jgi:hypothetical protein
VEVVGKSVEGHDYGSRAVNAYVRNNGKEP